jgi:putative nucleotidyltransferase with HDIG domain
MTKATSERSSRAGRPVGSAGRRLAEAFDAVSALPVLAEARSRLLDACARDTSPPGELAAVVECDAALAVAVMRAANNGDGPPARTGGVEAAIAALRPAGVRSVVAPLGTYDLLDQPGRWSQRHDRFRRHAVAVRHVADRIATVARLPHRDEIALAALLHDIGRLVLAELYGDEHGPDVGGFSPDERVHQERRELGIDHALVGGVLVRRWALPAEIATAVERHHAAGVKGSAGAVRLADLLVHHCAGDPVPRESLLSAAAAVGVDDEDLRALIFDFPHAGQPRSRPVEPCPLSVREIDALRGLAEGKVYKQIAQELSLSVSTVRTHLHNVYRKIGAVDRAQAVLLARDRGWI